MKRVVASSLFFIFVTILFAASVYARSGCCSHHGGVCGCGCCDGSPLSSTCAPYYPECNGGVSAQQSAPIYHAPTNTPPLPTWTPEPTEKPFTTSIPTQIQPTLKPIKQVVQTDKQNGFFQWIRSFFGLE